MSKYITEIVKDIRSNPETWKRYGNYGLQKGNIVMSGFGNGHKLLWGWCTSVVDVTINNKDAKLTFIDKYRLEETYKWWMRNATLAMIETE